MHGVEGTAELSLRRRLGIPDDAERVLIFTESSHWDPDWLYTSEEYFERFVRSNLDQALDELEREPRRVYSVECMFFFRMYWEHCPEQRERVRTLVNEGRLRLTSSGVTTADTLLPSVEAILRDFLVGQEWLRRNGMVQEPRLAYFTDSFGCTPMLPSLLKAAGFDRTAITRLDGMYFMGCDLESSRRFPRKGSSADYLFNEARSLDFVWRDGNGAEVLCHWNAFTYGQGDMLAYSGLSRLYLLRAALPARSDRHIARRIAQYVAQLAPVSRTPYMLCPIGFDFVEPIPDLLTLLDRYNQNHYPTTGVWVLNAGLDDYLALVETHRSELPVLALDPNPYWTGFYTSRPVLKQRCHHLVDALVRAEKLLSRDPAAERVRVLNDRLEPAWWKAVVTNHHDFITGTSPDRVVEEEQMPLVDEAAAVAHDVVRQLVPSLPEESPPESLGPRVAWSKHNGQIEIQTQHYVAVLDEEAGGAVVALRSQIGQVPLLTGVSNDLVSYRDSGGLWRMGMEFAGGVWRETDRASSHRVSLAVHEHPDGVEVVSQTTLDGEVFERRLWFRYSSPLIYGRVLGRAPEGYSVILRLRSELVTDTLTMDTPGGVITRQSEKIYRPTFWPYQHFVHLYDPVSDKGLAVLQPCPGAVAYDGGGRLDLVIARNATRERAYRLIALPCNPAEGHEREPYAFEYALLFTSGGDWQASGVHLHVPQAMDSPWSAGPEERALRRMAGQVVAVDNPAVNVIAVKPASRGQGIIVRLYSPRLPASPVTVTLRAFQAEHAYLCDARERDLGPLEVRDGAVRVAMPGTIATIRLLLR